MTKKKSYEEIQKGVFEKLGKHSILSFCRAIGCIVELVEENKDKNKNKYRIQRCIKNSPLSNKVRYNTLPVCEKIEIPRTLMKDGFSFDEFLSSPDPKLEEDHAELKSNTRDYTSIIRTIPNY